MHGQNHIKFNLSIEYVMLKYVLVRDDERNVETCSIVVWRNKSLKVA